MPSIAVMIIVVTVAIAGGRAAAQFSGQAEAIDGDDIEVCNAGACTHVRLCGIDPPEQGCPHDMKPLQCCVACGHQ
jgi:endonuclease YncB( thermonuclease family)